MQNKVKKQSLWDQINTNLIRTLKYKTSGTSMITPSVTKLKFKDVKEMAKARLKASSGHQREPQTIFNQDALNLASLFHIKKVLKDIFKKSPALLYGGSVDGNNVEMFKEIREIDGFLIGGASKSSKKFIDIIKNYYR